jgi:hypothetical protein
MRADFISRIKLGICRERLTGRGGFVLFWELWEHLGLSERLDRYLPQPGSGRGFRPSEMARSIIGLLLSGASHLSDITRFASDSLVLALNGFHKTPASNTLTSWLNRCERWVEHANGGGLENVTLVGVKRANRDLIGFLADLLKKTRLILDVDATLLKTKKRSANYTYKDFKGYQPQLAYLPDLGVFINSELRPGNQPCSKDMVSYLDNCKAMMPKGTSIGLLRADAANYQRGVLKWCLKHGIDFAIRAGRDAEVMRVMKSIASDKWEEYVDPDGLEENAELATCYHSMEGVGWFRLVVLRRRRDADAQYDIFDGKYVYFPIATSLSASNAEVVRLYNQRGRMEDGIGQLKGDFGLDAAPCSKFAANDLWIAIGILAFTLFVLFKMALGGDWVFRKAKAVRFGILNIPGKLVYHARELVLKLGCSAGFLAFLEDRRLRCRSLMSRFG